ncbi:MAG: heavy metal translocating P-type ATPase [Chthonomonadales bacterium]|nr:heavy metal translocating P-type ATPase [Chthonomonadales bacterium]
MKQSTFYIARMDCPTEEQLIRNRLRAMDGVDELSFDLLQRRLTITHRLDDDKSLLAALRSLGMEPRMLADAESERGGEIDHPGRRTGIILMALSGVAAAASEAVVWIGASERSAGVLALALLSMLLGGRDTIRKGWNAIRTATLNINFLMMFAIAGAMAIGQWPEAAMVTFLFGVAEMIEGHSLERARNAVRSLMEMTPETVRRRDANGAWREEPAGEVPVGAIVWVRPGERVPLDGVVTSGQSYVNQAPITGESLPVEKRPGDTVFAGTVNERGSFEFEVTANKGNTTLARIIRTVQDAQGQRAPTQRFIDRFAVFYTPAMVALAITAAAVPPLLLGQPALPWIYRALVLLVIACPCALVISTPVTIVSGLAAAARCGILIKGGAYLEAGRNLKVIALDKTGTLTHGRPEVTDVMTLNGADPDLALQIAASLDAHSEHPIASAIVARWTGANHTNPGSAEPERMEAIVRSGQLLPVDGFESITGRGVRGSVDGRLYYVGNHRLTEDNGVCGPHVEALLEKLEQQGKTTVVLTDANAAIAVMGVADTVRTTSVEAVDRLHRLGVQTVMLTGDNHTTARAIAERVGIDDVRGDLLPEDKLAAVSDLLARYGAVGMVGDGINDAPALARATIGIAMGAAGTDTALETADVALMQDDLRGLPDYLLLCRFASRVLKQNIALAIGIKAVFFALAVAGLATLWMAVFADMGASLLVVFNGLRTLGFAKSPARRTGSIAAP